MINNLLKNIPAKTEVNQIVMEKSLHLEKHGFEKNAKEDSNRFFYICVIKWSYL